ncbi:MAG: tetratricopeptide repeat protein [Stenomitos rutilans HA7619-LM2]|jgi:tetratricopeptide (TPR) repeat protein|nr:tetratricopeptide repeat protein [Stenomitos rutilans HA7619-LM2]
MKREQKAEGRGQKAEGRRQKAEGSIHSERKTQNSKLKTLTPLTSHLSPFLKRKTQNLELKTLTPHSLLPTPHSPLLLGLASSLLIALSGMPSQAQTASAGQGYTLLNQGYVNDAIAAFQRALQQNPQSLEAKLGLAIAYQKAGQDANAWKAYQQVLVQDSKNLTALSAIGVLGGYRPEWQARGIEALTTLLTLAPERTSDRTQRAVLYGYQGRFAEALTDYQILLQKPTPAVLLGAAQAYTYSGNYTEGVTLFERYRATGKALPADAVIAYATALRETGQPDQAIPLLEEQLGQLKPADRRSIEVRSSLAAAYEANQQSDRAIAVLQPLRNQPGATLPLARALSQVGRQAGDTTLYAEAIEQYRQALRQTANPSPGLVAEAADVLSEFPPARQEALSLYEQLLTQKSEPGLVVKRLIIARQLGRVTATELRQQLQTVLQPLPARAVERQAIALALVRLDPPDPALLPQYQELLQSGVDAPFLRFRVAQIWVDKGDFEQARQAIQTYSATSAGARDRAPQLLLAEIERREGKLDASAQRYEAVIASNPPAPVLSNALLGLADVRQAQGRSDEALRVYDQVLASRPQDLRTQLGRASAAYRADRITLAEAETVLAAWLQSPSATETPPELFSLVETLPADPKREALYNTLLAVQPDNLPMQRRALQVLAVRDPAGARSQVEQFATRNKGNLNAYFVQGDLAQTLGDLPLADQAYSAILQQQPNNVDAIAALAGVRFQQQRYAEAQTLYHRVLALRPNDLDTRRILGELSLAQDHPGVALQQFKALRAQSSNAPTATATQSNATDRKIEKIQVDLLRRRGFQPSWERY